MHPHLTHLGADVCRGLLHFAEGRPLGEHGLDWLFIQVLRLAFQKDNIVQKWLYPSNDVVQHPQLSQMVALGKVYQSRMYKEAGKSAIAQGMYVPQRAKYIHLWQKTL